MSKKRKKSPATAKKLSIKKSSTLPYRVAFIVLMVIFTLFFLNKLLKTLEYAGGLQVIVSIGLIGIFGYLGWEAFSNKWNKKRLLIVGLVGFVLIIVVYVLAFDPVLGTGGDNASYINNAKSLSSFKGFTTANIPDSPPDLNNPPVIPVLLTPIVHFFGINIVGMKMVPFCLGILFIILSFFFFKNYLPLPLALIITLLISINPSIVALTSAILTEVPFLCFSMLALLLLLKFEKQKKVTGKYCFLSGFFVVVVYWTRSVGLGFLGTSILYFILKKDYKKALVLGIIVLVFFLPWRIRNMTCPVSPETISKFYFLSTGQGGASFVQKAIQNLKIAAVIIPQNIFNYRLPRGIIWENNVFLVVVLIFTLIGYIWHLVRQRSQMDLYTPIVALAPLVISASVPLIISRYFIVLVPFLIYYFFIGTNLIFSQLNRIRGSKYVSNTASLVIMSLILFFNLLGNSSNINDAHRTEPYSPAYARFLDTARWAKENTPEDAYFGVRKPRTFYLFSDRHTIQYFGKGYGRYDVWSEDAEEKILSMYEEKNIDYLVLDRFSSSAHRLIYPIIRNNPDKFQVVYVTKKPETYVLKLNKWWE